MKRSFIVTLGTLTLLLTAAIGARAQTYDAGSTGADGAFTLPNATCPSQGICTIDVPASGVFNFTTFTVPSGWTLKFKRNATNTPVMIKASGNVTVTGTISLTAGDGGSGSGNQTVLGSNGGVGGAGGFDGGAGANGIVSTTGGTGGGPGGGMGGTVVSGTARGGGGGGFGLTGATAASGGGAGGPAYGVATLLPPVGGSGGGGAASNFGSSAGGGGGGGGAVTIASSGTISVTGAIQARGGAGGSSFGGGAGSGGAIRLAATTIAGSGTLDVTPGAPVSGGGAGSIGRIRVEAYNLTATYGLAGTKASIVSTPNASTLATAPVLRISAVAGITTPVTSGGIMSRPDVVLPIATTNPVQIDLTAAQIPLGTTILVTVRGQNGASSSVTSAGLAGTLASSTASVSLTLPTDQPSVVSATATFERVAWGGRGPAYAEGERVERVRVWATAGGPTRVTYITASGREIVATQ